MTPPVKNSPRTAPVAAAGATSASPIAKRNEASARAFFAAYSKGDAGAMAAQLSPNTTYDDPSFGHLSGANQVGKMWQLIAGGSTRVDAQVQNVKMSPDGKTATVDVVEAYSFLGHPIQNHITTTLGFGDDGKVTSQKDAFSWRSWGQQTGALSPLLESPIGHAAVRVLLRSELAAKEAGGWASGVRADLSALPSELAAKLRSAIDDLRKTR